MERQSLSEQDLERLREEVKGAIERLQLSIGEAHFVLRSAQLRLAQRGGEAQDTKSETSPSPPVQLERPISGETPDS